MLRTNRAGSDRAMASSSSPEFFDGEHPPQGGPLSSLNMGFLKNLSDKKKSRGMPDFLL
ncbi:hypothetical protein IMZ48_01745 [Candidatus Bathyarchaeota archaeon]|nr:hypothetical protein [Candidatus Bathyarchaeota archaeon]